MHVTGGDATRPAPARRTSRSRWRNPRLLFGIGLVLASAVGGGVLLSSARDSTEYWVVTQDVRAGSAVRAESLAPASARVDRVASGALVRAGAGIPRGVWTRDVPSGSLVTSDAVADATDRGREVPLLVAAGSLPADLATGHVVDVWSGPGPSTESDDRARRVFTEARVVAVSRSDGTGTHTVVVDSGVEGPSSDVVAQAATGHLTVVRVP